MEASTSILCISQHPADTLKQNFDIDLATPHVDCFILASETSIGIDQIRDLKSFANHPPMKQNQKTIVIMAANTLTLEAQNALLKLLEEPPQYLQMILCAPHTQGLLDTILSRCHIIHDIIPADLLESTTLLPPLVTAIPPTRLNLIPSTAKTADGAVLYCRNLIREAELLLQTQPEASNLHNLTVLTDCLTHLSQNANPTLCLTDAILQLK